MEVPECPVCLQSYNNDDTVPRVLSCGHTVCETCLKQLPQKHPHTIRCPACTQLIKYPHPQGPSALPKNIDLLRFSTSPLEDPISQKAHQDKNLINSHPIVSHSWSDEFYLTWKDWILPKDCIKIDPGKEEGEESYFCVFNGEFDLSLSLGQSNLAYLVKQNRKVSLVKVAYKSPVNNSVFENSYIVNVMEALSGMVEGTRDDLTLFFRVCCRCHWVCGVYGLWYNLDDGCIYLACEITRGSVLEMMDGFEEIEVGSLSFLTMSLEVCEILIRLHLEGLVIGCLGLSCFGFDDFGHFYIDLNEVLIRGRKVNRIVAEGVRGKQIIDESDKEVICNNLLKEDVFVSPELFFELLQHNGVESNRVNLIYSVGYNSDVWALACFFIRFLVGKLFIEEIANHIHNVYPHRCEENGLICPCMYMSWLEKVDSLLENKLGTEYAMLQKILCKCLSFDPSDRPLVTDVWKCLRQLIVKPQFGSLISPDGTTNGNRTGRCIVFGELCKLPKKIDEDFKTDKISSIGEGVADQAGKMKVDRSVVEGLASSNVKFVTMQGHLDCVTGLTVGGGFLFSSSFDKTINVWSLQDFTHVHSFRGHEHRVMAVIFVEGEHSMCISGDSGGGIFIWSISDPFGQEPLKKWNEKKDWRYSGIHALAVYGRENLYTGSGDKSIKAWSLQDYTLSCIMTGHRSVVSALAVSDGVLYSGSWDGTIRLWSLNDHSSLAVLEDPGSMGSVLSLSARHQTLIAAHENGFIKLWKDDVFKKTMQVHDGAIFATSLEGKWFFSGGWGKTIHVQELLGDEFHVDIRPAGSIACDSIITSLLYWQGKLFVGCPDRLIKVYYYGSC